MLEPGYPARTLANVRHSDATALFGDPSTTGSIATRRAAAELRKPVLHFPLDEAWDTWALAEWLFRNRVRVLNVAGNRESKAPGIGDRVCGFLCRALLAKPRR